jgi:hypothetical protein
MPELQLPANFDRIIARLTRGEPVGPDDLAKLAAEMHESGLSFTGKAVPRIFVALPPEMKAKLADAETRAGWDRAIERVNARIRST